MAHLDETLLQMTIGYDDLLVAAQVHAGTLSPGDAPGRLRAAGIVTTGGLNPVAAGLAEVALSPARSIVIERFDGEALVPLFVGWLPDGRAATSTPDANGDVRISGTDAGLLRDQLRQWLVIFDREVVPDREVVLTDTAAIDAAMTDASSGHDSSEDQVGLAVLLDHWRLAWRVNANWADSPIDATITVVDAGGHGFYRVDHPPRLGEELVDVTLVPTSLDEVVELLGDVVTGRNAVAADE